MKRTERFGGRRAGHARRRDRAVSESAITPALQAFLERGHLFWFLDGAREVAVHLGVSPHDADARLQLCAVSVSPHACVRRIRASGAMDVSSLAIDMDWFRREWHRHRDLVVDRARLRFGPQRSVWGSCVFDGAGDWDGPCDWIVGDGDGAVRGHDSFVRGDRPGRADAFRCPAGRVPDGTWFDGVMADRAAYFIERFCRQSKGRWAGHPVDLLRWQREDLVWPIFGWRCADGLRLIRQAYCEIPKKNGKSTLLSALMPYMLLGDGEGGPEVYTAGVDRQQAAIVFNESARMIRKSEWLSRAVEVVPSTKTIKCLGNDGVMRALSADNETAEGLNISALVVDEVHAHRRSDLIDALRYGGAARSQPLSVFITTAGDYDPNSIGWIMHEQAAKLISGTAELCSFWPVIYAAPPDCDWRDPASWRMANPSLGEILSEESMRHDCAECVASGRSSIFKRYRLNIWTQDAQAWIDADVWRGLAREFDVDAMAGDPCYGGLDLAASNDLAAFVLVFPPHGDRAHWRVKSWHFMAREMMARRSREHGVDYHRWERDGWIRAVGGEMIDLSGDSEIVYHVAAIAEQFRVCEVAYDPYLAAYVSNALVERHGIAMTSHRFGEVSMNAPMLETERLIRCGLMEHDGNPVMSWEMSNVIARVGSGGLMKPDKSLPRRKIDGPVALIMAVSVATRGASATRSPHYDFIVL